MSFFWSFSYPRFPSGLKGAQAGALPGPGDRSSDDVYLRHWRPLSLLILALSIVISALSCSLTHLIVDAGFNRRAYKPSRRTRVSRVGEPRRRPRVFALLNILAPPRWGVVSAARLGGYFAMPVHMAAATGGLPSRLPSLECARDGYRFNHKRPRSGAICRVWNYWQLSSHRVAHFAACTVVRE